VPVDVKMTLIAVRVYVACLILTETVYAAMLDLAALVLGGALAVTKLP
jgi:hypothetical protein